MDPSPGAWRPLLEGAPADVARRVVLEIAEALAEPSRMPAASLAGGGCGVALVFAYLDRIGLGDGFGDRAGRFLDAAIEAAAEESVGASLYSGFLGVAWAMEHLYGATEADGDGDAAEEADAALVAMLEESPWPGAYDLVGGLAGMAVYALERLPRPTARRCLELVLDRLEETVEWAGQGATWKTPPGLLIESTRQRYPEGYYNVGVAHGVPGLLVVLAAAEAAGIGGGRAGQLLAAARSWVLDQALPETGRLPYFVGPAVAAQPARLAWCYGDPGVAAALLAAGRAVGDERLVGDALDHARRAALQPTSNADVIDAGLCHGAAGVAHLFNRIHQGTGDETCADAARRWFARALELREPGRGVAGFLSWGGAGDGELAWQSDVSLLTGAGGVALALAAAVSTVEPAWDRILLASSRRP